MNDTLSILLCLVFSSIGLGYFIYGRRQSQLVARYSGIALMAYPYFFDSTYAVVAVGLLLMSLPRFVEI